MSYRSPGGVFQRSNICINRRRESEESLHESRKEEDSERLRKPSIQNKIHGHPNPINSSQTDGVPLKQ